jgi:hypothetical protein
MPGPQTWGPPIWTFFHTLAEKMNEKYFIHLKSPVFNIIKLISRNLPCPKCAMEASNFLAKINIDKIKNKQEFINLIYMFHNYVNKKNKKPLFNHQKLNIYNSMNIYIVFNNFVRVFHTRGNMQLLTESFQRGLAVKELKKWLTVYGRGFK